MKHLEIIRVRIGKWAIRDNRARCSALSYYLGDGWWGRLEKAQLFSRYAHVEAAISEITKNLQYTIQ